MTVHPDDGAHEVGGLLLYRAPRGVASLSPIADAIDALRAAGPARRLPRFAVIVLPVGSTRDAFVKELEALSLRHIGVQIDGTVAFAELVAAARARSAAPSTRTPSRD